MNSTVILTARFIPINLSILDFKYLKNYNINGVGMAINLSILDFKYKNGKKIFEGDISINLSILDFKSVQKAFEECRGYSL